MKRTLVLYKTKRDAAAENQRRERLRRAGARRAGGRSFLFVIARSISDEAIQGRQDGPWIAFAR